jgi:hypothetical protein
MSTQISKSAAGVISGRAWAVGPGGLGRTHARQGRPLAEADQAAHFTSETRGGSGTRARLLAVRETGWQPRRTSVRAHQQAALSGAAKPPHRSTITAILGGHPPQSRRGAANNRGCLAGTTKVTDSAALISGHLDRGSAPKLREIGRVVTSRGVAKADLAISTRMTRCCLTAAFAIDGRSSPGSGRLRMLMAVEPVTLFCRA